jgi:hypothetical protein
MTAHGPCQWREGKKIKKEIKLRKGEKRERKGRDFRIYC